MTTQTYGPPRSTEPLVVPVDPARGWQRADTGRRLAAVLALPAAAVMALAATAGGPDLAISWILLWTGLGPALFYSLARVLRPEPRSRERTPRHLLAAAATSFALPVLAANSAYSGDDGVIILLGTPAAVLGAVTVVWGLVAVAVRAGERR